MILLTTGIVRRTNCPKTGGEITIDIYSWDPPGTSTLVAVQIFSDLITLLWLLNVGMVAIDVDKRIENEGSFGQKVV